MASLRITSVNRTELWDLALNKGRSQFDELATTIVKACRVVAAYLNCNISAEWIPRRSNR